MCCKFWREFVLFLNDIFHRQRQIYERSVQFASNQEEILLFVQNQRKGIIYNFIMHISYQL